MLVLFDIDGTLILSGRAGVRGMNRSFERLFQVSGALDDVVLAGRTDRAIVTEALMRAGQPVDDDAIVRVREAYLDDLRDALADGSIQVYGDPDLVEAMPGWFVGVGAGTGVEPARVA